MKEAPDVFEYGMFVFMWKMTFWNFWFRKTTWGKVLFSPCFFVCLFILVLMSPIFIPMNIIEWACEKGNKP